MTTKISLMLLSLGLASSAAYAGMPAEPMPVSNDINVTAPDQSGMWSFGAQAVLMQPTNKDFNYADELVGSFNNPTQGSNDIQIKERTVDQNYHWWFGADISYAFPGNGRDVTLAYEGLHGTDSEATSSDAMRSTFSGLDYTGAKGESDTNYDAGDLVFGQKLDVGQRIRLHPFVGLRYAYINTHDTGYYTGGEQGDNRGNTLASSESDKLDNTFNGIGPRFGTDAQINLGQGFSIRGRLGLSALIGSRSIDNTVSLTTYNADGSVLATGAPYVTLADDSETRVIPEIDGRLGLNYTYDFDSNTALGFELGWQATNYFNVVADQPDLNPVFGQQNNGNNNNNNGNPGTHYSDNSNFGIQGPYARIQLDIA